MATPVRPTWLHRWCWALAILVAAPLSAQDLPAEACRDVVTPERAVIASACTERVEAGLTIRIVAAAGYALLQSHLAVAPSPEALPRAESGVPQLGHFPHTSLHETLASTTDYAVGLEGVEGDTVAVAIHVSAVDEDRTEHGGWAGEERFVEGGHPGRFFLLDVGG